MKITNQDWQFDGLKCSADIWVGNTKVTICGDNLSWDTLYINGNIEASMDSYAIDVGALAIAGGDEWVPLQKVIDYYFETYGQMHAEYEQELADEEAHIVDLSNLRLTGRI